MPFPTVVIGQKIRASWGNTVAARFNEAHALIQFTPAGNTDASAGAEADWVNLGNVTVPTWAVTAIVNMNVTGIIPITAAGNSYLLRSRIGTASAPANHFLRDTVPLASRGGAAAILDRITLTATGSLAVILRASRSAGTGQWRVDTLSRITAAITFLDN